ncbi:MAG: type 4a pilus biogenesis protein PilO [Candidatus Omnitrophica bacterium]|nr:type 4a pilus biogenesis protein PilO [Candidatus Omnitrophota bacterium]
MNLLKKLNSIDMQDLKNIDVGQLVDLLRSRVDLLANVIVVLLTIILAVYWPIQSLKQKKDNQSSINQYKEKQDILDQHAVIESDYNAYVETFPKSVSSDQLTNIISIMAVKNSVQIVSFSPAQRNSNDYRDIINVRIQIASEDYANIILFVKDLEASEYSMRVERWISDSARTIYNEQGSMIKADLEIASVSLKL